MSDKTPKITAVLMTNSKFAAGRKVCPKGKIFKAGDGKDITFEDAFLFVGTGAAKNLTDVADKLEKVKGEWVLPGDKAAKKAAEEAAAKKAAEEAAAKKAAGGNT